MTRHKVHWVIAFQAYIFGRYCIMNTIFCKAYFVQDTKTWLNWPWASFIFIRANSPKVHNILNHSALKCQRKAGVNLGYAVPPIAGDTWIQSDSYTSSCLQQRPSVVNAAHLSKISWGNVVCADNTSSCEIMCACLETNESPWMFPPERLAWACW